MLFPHPTDLNGDVTCCMKPSLASGAIATPSPSMLNAPAEFSHSTPQSPTNIFSSSECLLGASSLDSDACYLDGCRGKKTEQKLNRPTTKGYFPISGLTFLSFVGEVNCQMRVLHINFFLQVENSSQ